MSEKIAEANLNILIKSIETSVGSGELSPLNILTICLTTMQLVETVPNLKGAEKKELVLNAFHKYAETHNASDNPMFGLLPSYIDNMIGVNNGKITISIEPEKIMTCCFGIFGSKPEKVEPVTKPEKVEPVTKPEPIPELQPNSQ